MQHEEKRLSCAVESFTGSQWVRQEGPKNLIKSIFDDYQCRRVDCSQFSVEGLEAGAVTGRAVGQLPRVTDRPGWQLLIQLSKKKRRRTNVRLNNYTK